MPPRFAGGFHHLVLSERRRHHVWHEVYAAVELTDQNADVDALIASVI